jgi:hypothetical protein
VNDDLDTTALIELMKVLERIAGALERIAARAEPAPRTRRRNQP